MRSTSTIVITGIPHGESMTSALQSPLWFLFEMPFGVCHMEPTSSEAGIDQARRRPHLATFGVRLPRAFG